MRRSKLAMFLTNVKSDTGSITTMSEGSKDLHSMSSSMPLFSNSPYLVTALAVEAFEGYPPALPSRYSWICSTPSLTFPKSPPVASMSIASPIGMALGTPSCRLEAMKGPNFSNAENSSSRLFQPERELKSSIPSTPRLS